MVVRSDPAYPNTRGFLSGKDPQGIVILKIYIWIIERKENGQKKEENCTNSYQAIENTNTFVVSISSQW